jgi:hypothetical protein
MFNSRRLTYERIPVKANVSVLAVMRAKQRADITIGRLVQPEHKVNADDLAAARIVARYTRARTSNTVRALQKCKYGFDPYLVRFRMPVLNADNKIQDLYVNALGPAPGPGGEDSREHFALLPGDIFVVSEDEAAPVEAAFDLWQCTRALGRNKNGPRCLVHGLKLVPEGPEHRSFALPVEAKEATTLRCNVLMDLTVDGSLLQLQTVRGQGDLIFTLSEAWYEIIEAEVENHYQFDEAPADDVESDEEEKHPALLAKEANAAWEKLVHNVTQNLARSSRERRPALRIREGGELRGQPS